MLFTSLPFVLFFLLFFFLYWFVFNSRLNLQNAFLLAGSYFFYSYFEWKFTFLLVFISAASYALAILMERSYGKNTRKMFFIMGLIVNAGTLIIFKYFNFFIESASRLLAVFRFQPDLPTLNIILPLGISFYIFLSLSYLIDVYQRKLKAVHNPIELFLSLSFFPIILAGPIHRPMGLLPQIRQVRIFTYAKATDGIKQILWGVFMKMLIADQCGVHVNRIFAETQNPSGSTMALGVILFTIQIYADFAGYSNLAIGIAKLLGFEIMKNFAYPYFARDIREFWKRWNISLTSWFRDYIFLPIAYSVSRKIKSERVLGINSEIIIYGIGISITWLLTGLWHGANYTFLVWGFIHACMLFAYHVLAKPRKRLLKQLHISNNNRMVVAFEWMFTLLIIMISWIFFRSDTVAHAMKNISKIASKSLFQPPNFPSFYDSLPLLIFIVLFFLIEWLGRDQEYAIARLGCRWPRFFRWAFYYSIIVAVFWFSGDKQQFIYFQF
jgi:D-alanyl-lipoteichoic acid acyltransferase DltB (MBOAT superfamily)